jgi:putative NADH-flavin reductase
MKIALFGATGMIGSRVLAEARARGHEVTAVVRDPARAPEAATAVAVGDVRDADSVASAVAGHDAVVSAVGGAAADGEEPLVLRAAAAMLDALPRAGVERLLVVGGAGSLLTPQGLRLIDRPEFPSAWRPASDAQVQALGRYRAADTAVVWSYLSPADVIEPGERTGDYVLGEDHAVFDAAGESRISAEDYAAALVDELESPAHLRRRFTVGYA